MNNLFSLDTVAAKYYPLKIGNSYTYRTISFPPGPDTIYYRILFVKDSIFNGHKYFLMVENPGNFRKWRRIDSTTTNLMQFDLANSCPYYGHEILIDSLRAKKNDIGYGNCPLGMPYSTCNDTSLIIIFNIQSQFKGFNFQTTNLSINWKYLKYFGYYSRSTWYEIGTSSTYLMGCVINGVQYGDTSFPVAINEPGNIFPTHFYLSQNYPNPFNPTTTIDYYLPRLSFIKLSVFDINGKLISVLINNEQDKGIHQIFFDGSFYSSGGYFYSIECYDVNRKILFSNSKKMLLIK